MNNSETGLCPIPPRNIPQYTVIQYIRRKRKSEDLRKKALSKLTVEEQKALGISSSKRIDAPYGVMVAVKNSDGTFNTGYSLCNRRDRFNKKRALKIAIDRAVAYRHPGYQAVNEKGEAYMPHDVSKLFSEFVARCKKYYKNDVESQPKIGN
jgi:hypothetical protein